ncbi:D-amino acid dehydrogenase [Noviherbaspirillum saxi]|uniref:FAD-dependent oxidoreductase n=1 Tax=Noviherbaspirillum saxi TaxID=2320863 RepID=A0A3A3FRK5_9BURK|nr:D-amino acid dehydrogenase [Noviherbaspirillum saxi]RJF98463.1 FAD-dependent oxidoreductase [Noviherbaspirillum saxi]
MTQKQVAVIGGGVVGVCTAYFLAEAGHDVVVIERHHNVAQEASFTNAGMVAPGYVAPSAAPGMPRRILSSLFRSESAVTLKASTERALWRWARSWLDECELDRYRINRSRMQRIAFYSRNLLHLMREHYQIDYEQTQGLLQLFRSEKDLAFVHPAIDMLAEQDIPFLMLDPDGARAVEPTLASHTPLAAALYLPEDETGNCPLFAKRLKYIASSIGVQFHFTSTVEALEPEAGGIGLRINGNRFSADAVVVAAGADSARLLKPLGIRVPIYPVKSYAATALIKNFDHAPRAAMVDEAYNVSLARMGGRIRLAGIAEIGTRNNELQDRALRTLVKVGSDWFPHAASYAKSNFWCGTLPSLPDGPPLLGATPVRNLFINIGHGAHGWTMAAGSGKVVADLVSGRVPEIDLDGLTLARYG